MAFFITLVLQEVLVLGCSVALHLWTPWLFWKQTSCESFLDHISVLDGFGQSMFAFDTLLIHVAYDTCYVLMHVTFDTCYVWYMLRLIHVILWYMFYMLRLLHVTFWYIKFFHRCYTCYFMIHVIFFINVALFTCHFLIHVTFSNLLVSDSTLVGLQSFSA